jgi:uncharacterized protein (DUF433 family)
MDNVRELYGTADPRHLPAYGITETARYLQMPRSTLRAWALGQGKFKPILKLPNPRRAELSFVNVVEAHVLNALRKKHAVHLPVVRRSVEYVEKKLKVPHPLATDIFKTNGVHLFVEDLAGLLNVSSRGQVEIRDLIATHLTRVEFETAGLAVRLYPFTRSGDVSSRLVVMDPTISFGRPVLATAGIPTAVIADRFFAGESIPALASDYGRQTTEIEEAIRCEQLAAAA